MRDIIQPEKDLGHSDKKGHKVKEAGTADVQSGGMDTKLLEETNTPAVEATTTTETTCEDCQLGDSMQGV